MKTLTLMAAMATALTVALADPARAAGDHHHAGDDHQPRHGGIVATSKLMDYELVARPTLIQLYLRDHGKTVDATQAGARLTLLTGSEKQEVALKPAGNHLEAAGSFKLGPGTKVVAVVSLAGKPLGTARFALK